MAKVRDFKFCSPVGPVKCQPHMTKCPHIGHGRGHVTH